MPMLHALKITVPTATKAKACMFITEWCEDSPTLAFAVWIISSVYKFSSASLSHIHVLSLFCSF